MPKEELARFLICMAMLAQTRKTTVRQADLQLSATGTLSAAAIKEHCLMMAAIDAAQKELFTMTGRMN
jgi:hypothetical protein